MKRLARLNQFSSTPFVPADENHWSGSTNHLMQAHAVHYPLLPTSHAAGRLSPHQLGVCSKIFLLYICSAVFLPAVCQVETTVNTCKNSVLLSTSDRLISSLLMEEKCRMGEMSKQTQSTKQGRRDLEREEEEVVVITCHPSLWK